MGKLLGNFIILGMFAFGQTPITLAQPETLPKSQTLKAQQLQYSNDMQRLLANWGFTITNCQGQVAQIQHFVTKEIACIEPNSEIGVGNFVYDPNSNQIRPEEQLNPLDNQPTTGDSNNGNYQYVNPLPGTRDPRVDNMVFAFNNLYDYGTCLDAILLVYEERLDELSRISRNTCVDNFLGLFGNQLSRDSALQLVDSANTYATNLLERTLYPDYGLRRRAAINLGYIYEIDKNDRQMLRYADPAR